MSDWQIVTIESIKSGTPNALSTGPFGSAIGSQYFTTDGIPVIRGSNLSADVSKRLIEDDFVFVSEDKAKEFERSKTKIGDIIFTCWGTINQIGIIDENCKFSEYIISNKQMKLTPDPEKANSLFLYYLFSSPNMQNRILGNNIGSSVPGFNLGQLRSMEISIPSIERQNEIVSILSSLDDKIELLHRQNVTLEAVAETLFRQWFVEEAEESWESGRLGDLVDFIYGRTLKDDVRSGFGYPVVGSSGIVGYHDTYLVEGPGLVTGRKGTLGKINYMHVNFTPIDTTFYIVSKSHSKKLYFEYFLLQSLHLEEFNTDSAVPGLNRTIALSAEVILPSQTKIAKFNDTVDPLFLKIKRNLDQIKSLSKVRETMLPKLMSGELTVH